MSLPAPSPVPRPAFPDQDAYARKFFAEAVRHLDDASILHAHGRYPAAITSSMKAGELALKAVLIIEGSMGWWSELQRTHKPLEDIRQHPVLRHVYLELERHDAALIGQVTAMEKLAPARPDAKSFSFETQANTEYPFFYLQPTPAGATDTAHLVGPSEYFTEAESRTHVRTGHALLTACQALYPPVSAWGIPLPQPP
jgi:hypothetical protein